MSTIIDKMERNAKRYRERIEEIRRDWTRSEEAKRQDLEAAYSEARSTYAQLAEEYRTGLRERLRESRKAALSAPKVSKDEALDAFIYRDALDRASKTRDQRDLSEMLARAEISGDTPLARAVLYRGYERQNEHLVGSYLEKYPDERPKWDAFMDAAQEHNTLEKFGVSAVVGVPEPDKPQEIGYTVAAPVGGGNA